jgi:hypothetical protein
MQAVLDMKINLLADVISTPCMHGVYETLRYSAVGAEDEHTRYDAERPATLLPRDAQILGLFVDSAGNTFAYADDLYTTKLEYSLRGIVPNDSVVYAFLFRNAAGMPSVGIFDASRVHGHCLRHLPCIERFKAIHARFKRSETPHAAGRPAVYLHWVGHEAVLVHMLKCRHETSMNVDFAVDCVLRLSDALGEHSTCCKLLTQEPIVTEVPVLSTVKMHARLRRAT